MNTNPRLDRPPGAMHCAVVEDVDRFLAALLAFLASQA